MMDRPEHSQRFEDVWDNLPTPFGRAVPDKFVGECDTTYQPQGDVCAGTTSDRVNQLWPKGMIRCAGRHRECYTCTVDILCETCCERKPHMSYALCLATLR